MVINGGATCSAGIAEGRDFAIDEVPTALLQLLVANAPGLHRSWIEVFDQDVGVCQELE